MIGEKLTAAKIKKQLTNQAIADGTDVPIGTVSRILAGNAEEARFSNVQRIAKFLDVSLDGIYGDDLAPLPTVPINIPVRRDPCELCHQSGTVKELNDDKLRLHQDKEHMRANNMELLRRYNESTEKYNAAVAMYKNEKKTLKKERIFSRILLLAIIVFLIIEILFPDLGWIQY